MEISFPDYKKLVDNFGRHVDSEQGKDPVYLVDSSFFTPSPLMGTDAAKKHRKFNSAFFQEYDCWIEYNRIDEDNEKYQQRCMDAMGSIEKYFADYLEFLKTVFCETGIPAYITSGVADELITWREVMNGFRRGRDLTGKSERAIDLRKAEMGKREQEYVEGITGDVDSLLSYFSDEGVIDSEFAAGRDIIYSKIEAFVKSNAFKWSNEVIRKDVDEKLLATGLAKAARGKRVVILSRDYGFKYRVIGFCRDCESLEIPVHNKKNFSGNGGGLGVLTVDKRGRFFFIIDTSEEKIRI